MKKRGFKPNQQTITLLLTACANSKSPNATKLAQTLIAKASLSITPANAEFTPARFPPINIFHINALLKVYSRKSDLASLIQTYNDLRARSIEPDIMTYTTMLNAFARIGGDEGFKHAIIVWSDLQHDVLQRQQQASALPLKLDTMVVNGILLASQSAKSLSHVREGIKISRQIFNLSNSYSTSDESISKSLQKWTDISLQMHPSTLTIIINLFIKCRMYREGITAVERIIERFPGFKLDMMNYSSWIWLFSMYFEEIAKKN